MKLRFKANSLRLRVNQKEVQKLESGESLIEQVAFPGGSTLAYVLEVGPTAAATFTHGTIRVQAPKGEVSAWAQAEEIGMYFDFDVAGSELRVSIEKDLVCMDGPPEEVDLDAFPRTAKVC
jgi:hypothetical protein